MKDTKWILVSGGVLSGLGKGTATASIGKLLPKSLKIITFKCDGYLNVDPGTINPFEHGEVFVLDDGGEVDMDFGHYERFLNINCKSDWNLTSGKMFFSLINKERKGDFLGGTVQIIPHLTNEIKSTLRSIAEREDADVALIEIGGTIGDIENSWFVESARQLRKDVGHDNVMHIHLTHVPMLRHVGQQKTKPAQRDVEMVRSLGLIPDVIIARSEDDLSDEARKKLALFCDVSDDAVISGKDISVVYEVPLMFADQGMQKLIYKKFGLEGEDGLAEWRKLVNKIKNCKKTIQVAICGKYTALNDSYASLIEALTHAGTHVGAKIQIEFIETTEVERKKDAAEARLKGKDAIIVPIGFGGRGAEGKIKCIQYARENNIPYLGLCFGLQLAIIEYARNVCGLKDANSTEINPNTKNPVVDILPGQKNVVNKGGTMRLGSYDADLKAGTKTAKLYGSLKASERHRHRYEVNPQYHEILKNNGMVISGTSENGRLVEFIELANHPFFCATQAHPEYKSRLEKPSPLFLGFVKAALEVMEKKAETKFYNKMM